MALRLLVPPALAVALLLAGAGAGANAGTSVKASSLDRDLSAALDVRGVASKTSTAMVVELPSGRVVFARNPDLPLEPASNEKLCVTYAALVVLGADYRFPTEVLGEGRADGQHLAGQPRTSRASATRR